MDLTMMLSGPNLMLAGAIFVVVGGLKASFSPFFQTKIGQRLLPVLPPVMGIGGAFAGVCPPGYNWQNRVIIGIIAGYVSAHSFKIAKNSFLGFGLDDPPDPVPPRTVLVPPYVAPVPPPAAPVVAPAVPVVVPAPAVPVTVTTPAAPAAAPAAPTPAAPPSEPAK